MQLFKILLRHWRFINFQRCILIENNVFQMPKALVGVIIAELIEIEGGNFIDN